MDALDSGSSACKNLIRLTIVLMVIFSTSLSLAPRRADAQGINLATCVVGTHTAQWSPGVTHTEKLINVTTTSNWECSVPPLVLTSAKSTQTFQASFSCGSLFKQTPPITWVINWSDGGTSTYKFIASVTSTGNLNTTITGVGEIVDGRFKGANALTTFVLQDVANILNNDCSQPSGVTQMSGLTTLIISP
ncbi:hypothetical protein J3P77_22370 (plasmid) [Pseudomonas sp. R1-18]|uniref:hypothetical protein n=1 Tax=Pseudomonas sp. R1-18 TaxID=1632772 RepID=UPI003DA9F58D